MLIRIICFSIIVLIPAVALAQPRIVFDSDSYDFGKVAADSVLEHVFIVCNKGNEDLIIRKIEAP